MVTGVEEYGLFAQGIELPAEGLIHVSSLADDYYRFDRATHSLTGTARATAFGWATRCIVAVARVDVDRRELDLRLVARGKRGAGTQATRRAREEPCPSGKQARSEAKATQEVGRSARARANGGSDWPAIGQDANAHARA